MIVEVRLLDGFSIAVDGTPIPASRWSRRDASALVKILALSPRGRLHRDRVLDRLWPDATVDVALPRLHKAAHFARRALGDPAAVVLKDEVVALFPTAEVVVDASTFESSAVAALAADALSPSDCAEALKLAGDLLPDDLREPWLDEPRQRLRLRVVHLLRGARRWDDLVRLDPTNEEAHLELIRDAVTAGDRAGALRRYERMEQVLSSELGVGPPPEAVVLRQRLLTEAAPSVAESPDGAPTPAVDERPGLVERDAELRALLEVLRDAVEHRRGGVVLVSGEAGAGKSALVTELIRRATPGVRTLVGDVTTCWRRPASALSGTWPTTTRNSRRR